MTQTSGHIDANGNAFPVFSRGAAHNISVSNSTEVIQLTAGARLVSYWATGTVFIEFGDNTVQADQNSHAVPAGLVEWEDLTDNKGKVIASHISVYCTEGAEFYVSERV